MNAPRSARRLLLATFELYRRYPVLFFSLAAAVIVPYEAIALAATGTGNFSRGGASAGTQLLLTLLGWFLVTPLVSALHVNAVAEMKEGHEPRMGPVALRGIRVLPVVAAATIASSLGIFLGFLALIIPGVVLALRWSVVAQAAAIENEGWLPALHRSHQLTREHYWHIIAFVAMVLVITIVPALAGGALFGDNGTSPASFVVGLAVYVATASFSALAIALLFYDLEARLDARPQPASHVSTPSVPGGPDRPPSLDPRAYSDQDRPKGWYVDPSSPNRMLYWHGGSSLGWQGTTRTPRKIRQAWLTESRE